MPGKAAYLALENDADLEYEFFLASKLGMVVTDMRERMSQAEFVLWSRYHAREAQQRQLSDRRSR